MAIGHLWAGKAFGTNTGNLFLKLEGNDNELSGKLSLNDTNHGLTVFAVSGEYDGKALKLSGKPEKKIEGISYGDLIVLGRLNERGRLTGEWETTIGSMGTFEFFPHDELGRDDSEQSKQPAQIHTARHNFRAIAIDREQLTALADEIQSDFKSTDMVVTVVAETEHAQFLSTFKQANFSAKCATEVRLQVQQMEPNGVNKVAMVNFGPQYNTVMAQGSDETWVLGMLEKLKKQTKTFERTYSTSFKKMGFGLNQLLIAGAIVYIPSMTSLWSRFILLMGVLLIIFAVEWLHRHLLPHAEIYLNSKPKSTIAANIYSWFIAVSSALVAMLLAAYLQGHFSGI